MGWVLVTLQKTPNFPPLPLISSTSEKRVLFNGCWLNLGKLHSTWEGKQSLIKLHFLVLGYEKQMSARLYQKLNHCDGFRQIIINFRYRVQFQTLSHSSSVWNKRKQSRPRGKEKIIALSLPNIGCILFLSCWCSCWMLKQNLKVEASRK